MQPFTGCTACCKAAKTRDSFCGEGRVLTVTGETPEWYQAIDSVTGKTGFVSKAYVTK